MATDIRNDRVMEYKKVHDIILTEDVNNIKTLLRKFKQIKAQYKLNKHKITGKHGDFNLSDNLVFVNNKYKINGELIITNNLNSGYPNCNYTIVFQIISENLTGTNTSREYKVTVTSNIHGGFMITVPDSILDSNEYLSPDVTVYISWGDVVG